MFKKNEKLMEALKKQKNLLESSGHVVAYISVYGSQNYGLDIYSDDYKSDIDMKAIVIPTLDNLIENSKPVSQVIDTEWGQCDIKDIRSYMQTLLKANPSYIESILTDYYIIDEKFENEFDVILEDVEVLVGNMKAQFIRALYGMMCEKQKALTHPYPSIAHKIEKWGYDGKQAHHILRLYFIMKDYYQNGKSLKESISPNYNSFDLFILRKLKLNAINFESAESLVSTTMNLAKEFKDTVLSNIDESNIDETMSEEYSKMAQKIIKKRIMNDCQSIVSKKMITL